ncbi:hypothetical protein Tcan_09403 [Toxocara canis]|uniref:Uncharacterized protein n=1 Tax=Toxocara canis TaxID=6265 RepID=A0A0B2UMF0_TOXCA|nr:hypothetical protein Tcan_09403 [Toxocara canis]
MDGQRIREVSDLMSRGAYVLIPVGQSFRETWYFLPDNAIDTSEDNEKVLQRSEQRDRLIQRRLRHEAAIRSNITNNRRPPQLQKDKSRLRTMSSPLSASTSKLCNGRSESEDSRVEADQHYAHRPQSKEFQSFFVYIVFSS